VSGWLDVGRSAPLFWSLWQTVEDSETKQFPPTEANAWSDFEEGTTTGSQTHESADSASIIG